MGLRSQLTALLVITQRKARHVCPLSNVRSPCIELRSKNKKRPSALETQGRVSYSRMLAVYSFVMPLAKRASYETHFYYLAQAR